MQAPAQSDMKNLDLHHKVDRRMLMSCGQAKQGEPAKSATAAGLRYDRATWAQAASSFSLNNLPERHVAP